MLYDIQSSKEKYYKTISLPVVLCGCETSSVTLREEDRLLVFENGVMEINYTRLGKLTGFIKKIHIEWLHFSSGIT
jgi:hypothetical protein